MLYSFRAFRLFRYLYLIPKRIMRKFKENYAVKLSVKCRQTICDYKDKEIRWLRKNGTKEVMIYRLIGKFSCFCLAVSVNLRNFAPLYGYISIWLMNEQIK